MARHASVTGDEHGVAQAGRCRCGWPARIGIFQAFLPATLTARGRAWRSAEAVVRRRCPRLARLTAPQQREVQTNGKLGPAIRTRAARRYLGRGFRPRASSVRKASSSSSAVAPGISRRHHAHRHTVHQLASGSEVAGTRDVLHWREHGPAAQPVEHDLIVGERRYATCGVASATVNVSRTS